MKSALVVLMVVAMVLGMGAARIQETNGVLVTNGDFGCDDNPNTPNPPCYFVSPGDFTINSVP